MYKNKDYRYGVLTYAKEVDRLDIKWDEEQWYGWYHGGLHCGQGLEIFINNEWVATRVEMYQDWYMVGLRNHVISDLFGCRVRVTW